MKKIILLFLSLLLLVSVAAAEKQLGMREYTSVDELASTISSYFPRVQGEVKSVESGTVTVALGSKNGLQPGVVLTLWREGREILHPVTGAVIGRAEDEVGTLEVKTVQETTATGTMEKKLSDPKPGDTARITPKKISLALVPIGPDRPEITAELAARLNEQGRFAVLDREKTAAFLKDRTQDSALIREMGGAFKLDVVLTVEVHPSDGKHLVTAVIYYADEARPFETITAMLDLRTKRDALGEVKPFFAPVPAQPEVKKEDEQKGGIPELPFEAQLFAAADLEGNGGLQYVFSDGVNLHVYRSEPTGWRETWAETAVYPAGEMQHINLDVADINGNGKPEIFVTAMLRGKVVSSVIEYRDSGYQRIAEVPGFLRVMNSRRGSILLGQAYDPVSFSAGRPKQYAWSDGSYIAGAEYPLPKELRIYGFTVAEFGEAAPLLVGLDEKNRLVVYSNNAAVWRSDEKYSGVGVSVMKPETGIDAVLRAGADADKSRKVRMPGRVFAMDLNNDGRDEILLPKHKGDSIVSGFTDADLVALGWTGARLEQRWSVPDIPGLVPDLQVLPRQGGGARVLALVKTLGGLFKRDRVGVITYSVQ